MDAEKLAKMKELATPGPWYVRGRMLSRVPDSTGMGGTLHTNHIANFASREDCEYVHAVLASHDALAKRVEELGASLAAEHADRTAVLRKIASHVFGADPIDAAEIVEQLVTAKRSREELWHRVLDAERERDALRARVEELAEADQDDARYIAELTDKLERAQASSYEEAARADAAERERDDLRAAVERVREACAELRACNSARTPVSDAVRFAASEIKAVLPREEG